MARLEARRVTANVRCLRGPRVASDNKRCILTSIFVAASPRKRRHLAALSLLLHTRKCGLPRAATEAHEPLDQAEASLQEETRVSRRRQSQLQL